MTELGTFGAVVGFALDLERRAAEFYQSLIEGDGAGSASEILQALARAHKKRQQLMEQMRRENVTEMILEPIHGLEREEWEIALGAGADEAAGLERHIADYCLAASRKVSIPQVARQFGRLAAEGGGLEDQARLLG